MIYEKFFPLKTLKIEGSSAYAASVDLASLNHLSTALAVLFGPDDAPVCLDVGANIGLTTLLMDQSFKGGRVLAFEPHPVTFGQMDRNISANQTGTNRIETFNFALGKADGEVLFRDVDQYNTGNSFLLEGSLAAAQDAIRVPVRTLDGFDGTPDHIDLMKIDVEGFELDVLKGAEATLARVDTVLIEFNHWCLSSLAHVLPIDALAFIFDTFEGVFVFDLKAKAYVRVQTDAQKWSFLHKNMVNFNVNDLLCTNSSTVIRRVTAAGKLA
ncbi:FkbM family methyltransferase [Pseudorhodobacter ferrugineus]|uniref:FkbM family methyltransferase n=1 Tax=Pseudorhodobacter ferrugineus TaxID=77008 RepID=UPI0003B4539B|nr:FkbM family methyltransferase [Pseudorhodobacter ferrugineus]